MKIENGKITELSENELHNYYTRDKVEMDFLDYIKYVKAKGTIVTDVSTGKPI